MTAAQIATLVLSICSLLGVGTAMTLFWNDMHNKKKQKLINQDEEHKLAKKIERKKELEEMAQPIVDTFVERLDRLEDKIDAIGDGTLSTLRNEILSCYYKCSDKQYRNNNDYTNIHDMYESYKRLNGNSFVADVIERFDALPAKEEYFKRLAKEGAKAAKSAADASKVVTKKKKSTSKEA